MAKKDKNKDKEPEKEEEEGKEAPTGEGEAGAEGAVPPKKSKKKLIIIAILLIVLLAGGSGAFFMLGHKHEDKQAVELGPDGKPLEKPVYYTLPDFLVNLNTGGKQTSFLKATIVLEVPHQGDIAQIEANLPRLSDAFNTYLRELRPSDLSGSAGIERLREELMLRANKALDPVKINDVLFKEIIIQ